MTPLQTENSIHSRIHSMVHKLDSINGNLRMTMADACQVTYWTVSLQVLPFIYTKYVKSQYQMNRAAYLIPKF